jgi:hypothetical protein
MHSRTTSEVYEKIYRKLPQGHVDRLRRFRATHPHKHLSVDGVTMNRASYLHSLVPNPRFGKDTRCFTLPRSSAPSCKLTAVRV